MNPPERQGQGSDGLHEREPRVVATDPGVRGRHGSATWESDGLESWRVEIEVDCFSEDEGFVVSIDTEHREGKDSVPASTLVTPSPAQARGMALALLSFADNAERNQRRVERDRAERLSEHPGPPVAAAKPARAEEKDPTDD